MASEKRRLIDVIFTMFGGPAATMRKVAVERADHAIALAKEVHDASEVQTANMQEAHDPYREMMKRLERTLR